jgi:hypothetical protein
VAPRIVRDPELIEIRDLFKLQDFCKKGRKTNARRGAYFETIDMFIQRLEVHWEEMPHYDDVVFLLVRTLNRDPTFRGFVRSQRQNATDLTDRDLWTQICNAAAGTVLHQYLVAVENGEWAPTGVAAIAPLPAVLDAAQDVVAIPPPQQQLRELNP